MTIETQVRQADGTGAGTRPVRGTQPDVDGGGRDGGRPTRGRLVGAAIVLVLAVGGGSLWASPGGDPGNPTRADEAATARLEQQAEQHELARLARGHRAATARLEQQAEQHELARQLRSDRAATARLEADAARRGIVPAGRVEDESPVAAATARLEQLAERYEVGRRARSRQAATDRLTRLAEAVSGR